MNHRASSHIQLNSPQRMRDGHGTLRAWLTVVLAAPVSSLLAHPGHDHAPLVPPSQPAHWFIEPEHAVTWLAVGVLTWTLYHVLNQRTIRTEPASETHR